MHNMHFVNETNRAMRLASPRVIEIMHIAQCSFVQPTNMIISDLQDPENQFDCILIVLTKYYELDIVVNPSPKPRMAYGTYPFLLIVGATVSGSAHHRTMSWVQNVEKKMSKISNYPAGRFRPNFHGTCLLVGSIFAAFMDAKLCLFRGRELFYEWA